MDKVEYGSELYVAVDGAYAGRLVISDTIKDDAVDAIPGYFPYGHYDGHAHWRFPAGSGLHRFQDGHR